MQLHDKTVFLTGAASGLGRELALQFDQSGCHLLLADCDSVGLENLSATLSQPPQNFIYDLGQPVDRTNLLANLKSMATRINIIVHCAGIGSHSHLDQLTPDEVNQVLQVNTLAPLELTAGLLALLPPNETGAVVTIGSVAGELTTPSMSLYSASKAALHAFSRATAIELATRGHFSLLVILGALKNPHFVASIRHPANGQPGWYRRLDIDPTQAAARIIRAIKQQRSHLVIPGWYSGILAMSKLFVPLADVITRTSYYKFRATSWR